MDPRYMTTAEVATLRRMTPGGLRTERHRGAGPPWLRIGPRVLYPVDALEEWLARRLVVPPDPLNEQAAG